MPRILSIEKQIAGTDPRENAQTSLAFSATGM